MEVTKEMIDVITRVYRKEMLYAQRHKLYEFETSILNMSFQELERNYVRMAKAIEKNGYYNMISESDAA